ncbi:MAG: UDP-N-acetylglucosamine 2-epimerase [Phycisphaerae bacterium]
MSNAATPHRIACLSTSRADAGIYRPLLRALASRPEWRVFCLAGGTHGSPAFGQTIDTLRDLDGVRIVPVRHRETGDSPVDIALAAGHALAEFSKALAAIDADLVFVLGDRTEMLAATLAAAIHRIPIAHLHGGERTAGAYDDGCRHAITKLAHIHFAAVPEFSQQIAAMGEAAWRIHTVGALALDDVTGFEPEPVEELSAALGLDFSRPTFVVLFHPETLSIQSPAEQVSALLNALGRTEANLLIVGTNADVGHLVFTEAYRSFVADRPSARLIASLPKRRFWSCLAHARVLIGNSSAGIIEAASFKLPAVNIGERQTGRPRAANVIDTPCEAEAIARAIGRASSAAFRNAIKDVQNPYGDGRAASRIVAALARLPDRQTLLVKA